MDPEDNGAPRVISSTPMRRSVPTRFTNSTECYHRAVNRGDGEDLG